MTAEPERHSFLVFRYPGLHFFINRNSVETSLFLEPVRNPLKPGIGSGFSADIPFRGEVLTSYDLDRFLEEIRSPENRNGAGKGERRGGVALILPLSGFSSEDRSALRDRLRRGREDRISETRVALKMPRHGETESIPLKEIRLFPPGLRRPLRRRGILGCRFPAEGECQWFLDAERIWMNAFKDATEELGTGHGA